MRETVKCSICGKEFKSITKTHLKHKHQIDFDEYKRLFPGASIKSESTRAKMREKMVGREIKWKDKIATAVKKSYDDNPEGWGRTGVPATDEMKKIVSKKMMGRIITPEARAKISKSMETNHISKTDPERWKRIVKRQIATRIKNESNRYSKSEKYALKYISKYFSIFHKITVIGNNSIPFKNANKNLTVDMAIPEFKIAIEWDGEWHRQVIVDKKSFYKTVFHDSAKNKLIPENGWVLVRVRYDSYDSRHKSITKRCNKICRDLITKKLLPLVTDEDFHENWKNEYALTKDEFEAVRKEYQENKKAKSDNIV